MRLIKPSFELMLQEPGFEGLLKHVELCARTAYKSEDKITSDSAKGFIDMIIKKGHGAVLEHGTVYLTLIDNGSYASEKYIDNKYSVYTCKNGLYYITTNYRVLIENDWLNDLTYQCECTPYHEKRITVKFICDRGVSHEYVRHRVFSFVQESTR
jgi:thymidylate synthase (FAD)